MHGETDRKAHQLLIQHWHDLARRSYRDNRPYFTDFLPQEDEIPAKKIAAENGVVCMAWGGTENTARVMLCFAPDSTFAVPERFPITCLTISHRGTSMLRHRDVLGALMACDIRRDLIGDILIAPKLVQIFVCSHIVPILLQELSQIGRVGVSVADDQPVCLAAQQNLIAYSGTVASLRADAVTAFVTHLSREKASQLIRQGKLVRAHETVETPSASMQIGDVFSIRGYGKFRLDAIDGTTRKGRYHITIQKYQ